MASLQDQLLKAGLADEKKAKEINKEKRKQAKQLPKGQTQVNEAREQARATLAEQAQRDRELAAAQRERADKKAIAAQIKQLIAMNRIARDGGDVPYQFTDGSKIKKLYVTSTLQNQLANGIIAIVRLEGNYELVPAQVAEKIAQRDAECVLQHNTRDTDTVEEDDPYADYQIPDDLMW